MNFLDLAAGVAALGGIAYWNYYQQLSKPRALPETSCAVTAQPLIIPADGHQLYGELMLPVGQTTPLPTVICCHGFGASYKMFKNGVGKSLAMSGFAVYYFDFYGGNARSKSGGFIRLPSIPMHQTSAACGFFSRTGVRKPCAASVTLCESSGWNVPSGNRRSLCSAPVSGAIHGGLSNALLSLVPRLMIMASGRQAVKSVGCCRYPIYTKVGPSGGVFVLDSSRLQQRWLTVRQRELLMGVCGALNDEQALLIKSIIGGMSPLIVNGV